MKSLRTYLLLELITVLLLVWIWGLLHANLELPQQSVRFLVLGLFVSGTFISYLTSFARGKRNLILLTIWWFSSFALTLFALGSQSVQDTSTVIGMLILMLLWGLFLFFCRQISQHIETLEFAIFDLSGGTSVNKLGTQQSIDSIQKEMLRSRYSENPLSVIAIQADYEHLLQYNPNFIKTIYQRYQKQFHRAEVSRWVTQEVRLIDHIYRDDRNDQIILICPETAKESAAELGTRLKDVLMEQRGIRLQTEVATYPEDGVTFDGLLDSIRESNDDDGSSERKNNQKKHYDFIIQTG